ncbi:MAG: GTP-binding protein [Pirellulaceae bacterium]|nr:GTP-binding protein [Planctomycetales bacterium]
MNEANATTFATLLTPPGRGAVATIDVFGPRAESAISQHFRGKSHRPDRDGSAEIPVGSVRFGCWLHSQHESPGGFSPGPIDRTAALADVHSELPVETGEDVVVARTAHNRFEIHCHGGVAAPRSIIRSLVAAGCRAGSISKWLESEGRDRLRREARTALGKCLTARTAMILLDQFQGALGDAIAMLASLVRDCDVDEAMRNVDELLEFASVGLHLTRPWNIVLAGAPNVGKSSLVNRLMGYDRSIVYDQPGTTRDVVTAMTAIDGWPVELSDTAGLREDGDAIERIGIRQAMRQLAQADLVLLVYDATCPDSRQAWGSVTGVNSRRIIYVANKVDLLAHDACVGIGGLGVRADLIATSAATGAGIPQLWESVGQRLWPKAPQQGDAVPFHDRHVELLKQTRTALGNGDLQMAANTLAAITD